MYYGGYGMYNGFYNTSYILVIIGAVISMGVSAYMKSTVSKYNRIMSASGLTGRETAIRILRDMLLRSDH